MTLFSLVVFAMNQPINVEQRNQYGLDVGRRSCRAFFGRANDDVCHWKDICFASGSHPYTQLSFDLCPHLFLWLFMPHRLLLLFILKRFFSLFMYNDFMSSQTYKLVAVTPWLISQSADARLNPSKAFSCCGNAHASSNLN